MNETKEPKDPRPEDDDPGRPETDKVPQGADPGPATMEYFEKGKKVEPDDNER